MPLAPEDFVNEARALLGERPGQIAAAQKAGRKMIGFFCCYIPEEMIFAARMIPVRMVKYGRGNLVNLGVNYLCPSSCPLACAIVGHKKWNRDFYFKHLDYVADAPSCMQMHRALEVWEKYFDTKVIPINFPRNYYAPAGLEYYRQSLLLFKEELEEISGSPIRADDLAEAVELFNDIRKHLRRFYDSLKSDQPLIKWPELMEILQAGFLLDRRDFLDLLKRMNRELVPIPFRPRLRILLYGGTMAPGDTMVPDIIHRLGAEVVMDESCAGSRSIYGEIREGSIGEIARRYLENLPCDALSYPKREGDRREENLRKMLSDYRLDGLIFYTLRFCDGRSFKVKDIDQLAREAGVPMLTLVSGYSDSDKGQMTTRIEAFLESLGT
ncbi:MAG: 2-hydroxyacyl-CoA dehydratase subunit D [bacterium]